MVIMKLRLQILLPLLLYSLLLPASRAVFKNNNLPSDDLFRLGDVLLGGLVRLYYPDDYPICGQRVARVGVQVASATIWTIEQLNLDNTILPNITLGYAILNDCGRESVALGRATKFLPPSECLAQGCGGSSQARVHGHAALPNYYRVAAVLGPYSSGLSVPVSSLLSLYEVPHISWSATSQELSDKSRFRYFSRMVPPDQYQAEALVKILIHFNWTYISTLHSTGSYGINGIREVHQLAKQHGICIAYSRGIGVNETDADHDETIVQLRKNYKARIVVVFSVGDITEAILKAIRRNKATEFVYLGTEGFQPTYEFDAKPIDGLNAFILNIVSNMDEDFRKFYMLESDPWRNDGKSGNPWFGEYSPSDVDCSWNIPKGHNNSCHNYKSLKDFPQFYLFSGISRVIDIVYTYALALDALIRDNCPEAFQQKWRLETCLRGELFLSYIRNVSFQGSSAYITFDGYGDLIGDYVVTQTRGFRGEYRLDNVGTWSRRSQRLTLNTGLVRWPLTKEDVETGTTVGKVPESVCAKECNPGEFYIQGELDCCWDCQRCRDNERIHEDKHSCVKCPTLSWPDAFNFTICEAIKPSFLRWYSPLGMALMAVATLGILSVTGLAYVFIQYSDRKVIKGSSRELMAPIGIGIFFAYFTVYTYIVRPGTFSCYFSYFGFHFSCTFIFGPLFLKTNRLYRIFAAAERCEQGVKMVDGKSQVLLFLGVVVIQVILTVMAAFLQPSGTELKMPVETQKEVELFCNVPLQNLFIPLGFNLILLFLCAVFGFLTRRLPDNFNESWYIFISVVTTAFIWVAFLPTYFAAFFAFHKSALLALALILNGVVISLCLFAPKIYAVYCVDENSIKVTNWVENEETNSVLGRGTSVSNVGSITLIN